MENKQADLESIAVSSTAGPTINIAQANLLYATAEQNFEQEKSIMRRASEERQQQNTISGEASISLLQGQSVKVNTIKMNTLSMESSL